MDVKILCQVSETYKENMNINEIEVIAKTIAQYTFGIVSKKEFVTTPHGEYLVTGDIQDVSQLKLFVDSNSIELLFPVADGKLYKIGDKIDLTTEVLKQFSADRPVILIQALDTEQPEFVYVDNREVVDITELSINVI